MQQASAGDMTAGIVALCVSIVSILAILNALVTRYFRWRVSREPKLLDTFTQREFDWSWNLTALVTVSHIYGLLWALDALNIPLRIFSGDFLNGAWIPAVIMIVAYITLFISTGRHRPSKSAILVFAAVLALALAIGFLIAGMLLASVDPAVLASVFGTNNPLRPGDIVSIYATMGFFIAPDFLLINFLVNMVPLAVGYLVCQLIDATIKLGKRFCPAPPAPRNPSMQPAKV